MVSHRKKPHRASKGEGARKEGSEPAVIRRTRFVLLVLQAVHVAKEYADSLFHN